MVVSVIILVYDQKTVLGFPFNLLSDVQTGSNLVVCKFWSTKEEFKSWETKLHDCQILYHHQNATLAVYSI